MRSAALIALPVALLCAAAPAVAAQPAAATLAACDRGAATFEGAMSAIAGAQRMQMRFSLHTRARGSTGWVRVAVPGWAGWSTAATGRRRFVFTRRVENLVAPAEYRAVVRFRWRDGAGARIAAARRVTRICPQGDLRPDLVPRRLRVLPGATEDRRTYEVLLRNTGGQAAVDFAVGLIVDGRRLPDTVVESLGAGAVTAVRFDGPPCPAGARVEVLADATGAVEESDESDDRLVVACPA